MCYAVLIHYDTKLTSLHECLNTHHHQSLHCDSGGGTNAHFTTACHSALSLATTCVLATKDMSVHSFTLSCHLLLLPPASSSSWHSALQDSFGKFGRPAHMAVPSQLPLFHSGQQVLIGPDGCLYPVSNLTVGHMVFVWDVEYSAKAPHVLGFDLMLQLHQEGPCLTCIEEDWQDWHLHQLYLCPYRDAFVISDCFQSHPCLHSLCNPGEDFWLRVLISNYAGQGSWTGLLLPIHVLFTLMSPPIPSVLFTITFVLAGTDFHCHMI